MLVCLYPMQSVVAETPRIKQCFLVEEDSKTSGGSKLWHLKTDGVNLHVCIVCVYVCASSSYPASHCAGSVGVF